MSIKDQSIVKAQVYADRLNIVRWFFVLPFVVLYRFFKGKSYYDPKRQ